MIIFYFGAKVKAMTFEIIEKALTKQRYLFSMRNQVTSSFINGGTR
jgi:hypothetical protein